MPPVHRGSPAAKGEGPPSASELLRLLPTMRRAIRRAGIRQVDLVDDLAGAALLRAWLCSANFVGFPGKRHESLSAWVSVIAWRTAKDHRKRALLEQQVVEVLALASVDRGPERQIEARDLLRQIAQLPRRLRVMAAAVAITANVNEAARDIGLKPATAFSQAQRLRAELRRWWPR